MKFILAIFMVLGLSGCGNKNEANWFVEQVPSGTKIKIVRGIDKLPSNINLSDYTNVVVVTWLNKSGPTESAEKQLEFEKSTDDLEKIDNSFLALVVSSYESKKWYWLTKNTEIWNSSYKPLIDAYSSDSIEISIGGDAEWQRHSKLNVTLVPEI